MSTQRNNDQALDTINTLAAQTELLAINALAEAAQMGYEGQGFALVAEELQNLADLTNRAISKLGQEPGSLSDLHTDKAAIANAIKDQLKATEDLRASVHTVSQLTAEMMKTPGVLSISKEDLDRLDDTLKMNLSRFQS